MALRESELNPGEENYQNTFNSLNDLENNSTKSEESQPETTQDLVDNEQSFRYVSPAQQSRSGRVGKVNSRFKKGPIAAIFSAIVLGLLGISGGSFTSLELVHIKESIVGSFRVASLDSRLSAMWNAKSATLSSSCSKLLTKRCSYTTLSTNTVDKLAKSGIIVEYDATKTTLTGRVKPTSIFFNGEEIKPSNFSKKLKNDVNFRAAVQSAYNPRFMSLGGSIWNKVSSFLGINKNKTQFEGEDIDERLENTKEKVNKTDSDVGKSKLADNIDETNEDGTLVNDVEEINKAKKVAKTADDIAENVDTIRKTGTKSATAVLESSSSVAKSAIGKLNVLDTLDTACSVFSAMNQLSRMAKAIRVLQLAKYAMLFLNIADQIKAGDARAEDVETLGTILNTEINRDVNGTVTPQSATDSFGYKYMAYGEIGKTTNNLSQYMAGGGLTGTLSGVSAAATKAFSKAGINPRVSCNVIQNPLVQVPGILVGIASLFAGVGFASLAANVAINALPDIALAALPYLLQDIVAGVIVDDTTVGDNAGNALISGAGSIMSQAAHYGGNAPLTPEEAVAYDKLNDEVIARYNEADRLNSSPFDVTNPNTFMGNIVSQLIPYSSKTSSIASILSAPISMYSNILSSTTLANASDPEDEFTMCDDIQYLDPNGDGKYDDRVATDPFCNVTYGMPVDSLDEDSLDVLDYMIDNGHIDEMGVTVSPEYENFLTYCINRTTSIGDAGDSNNEDDGTMCIIDQAEDKKQLTNFYLYYQDSAIDSQMSGTSTTGTTETSTEDDNAFMFYEINNNINTIVENDIQKYTTPQNILNFNYIPYNINQNQMNILGLL